MSPVWAAHRNQLSSPFFTKVVPCAGTLDDFAAGTQPIVQQIGSWCSGWAKVGGAGL